MDIVLKKILVRDLVEGYDDQGDDGVFGYGGKLNIRPPYQRAFVYKDKERDAVIESINSNFPLNVMYWVEKDDGTYELLDGQQRTVSICDYVTNEYALNKMTFDNLQDDEREKILDYTLMIYWCKGQPKEVLDWFKIINIAGKPLTHQEMRNAIYHGPWVTDAKKYFSKTEGPAYNVGGKKYLAGTANRQDYLEAVLKWVNNGDIEGYMAKNQHEASSNPLRLYFKDVIDWVEKTFPTYRKQMKGRPWGAFYNEFKDKNLDPSKLEEEVARLMEDDDVTDYNGIYAYVLTRQEKHLNIRAFKDHHKSAAYKRQKGVCPGCKKKFTSEEMEADHITPWSEGGKTIPKNCQMLCRDCNRRKSNK